MHGDIYLSRWGGVGVGCVFGGGGGGGGGKGARGRRGNRINIVSENYHED